MKKQLTKSISLKSVIIATIITAVFGLIVYNMKDMLFGAPLLVQTETDGKTVEDQFLPISGKAKHARAVLINGRPVALDREGNFIDGALLSPGYNVVEVGLKDQFGKEKVKQYHFVMNPADVVAQTPSGTYQQ